jgi:hypothetical protein
MIAKVGVAASHLAMPSAAAAPSCELDGEDLRRELIETRKSTLKSLLRGKHAGYRVQRALHRGWRYRLPAGLCARLRGHCVEAHRLGVPFRPGGLLDKGQKPGGAGGHA